ncbi:hypothetical protein ACKVMT_14180 [Halobacteriales archaeon Cl-PHB]
MQHELDSPSTQATSEVSMNKELFGVFGDREAFADRRAAGEFDTVVEAEAVTVGVRSPGLDVPGRSQVHDSAVGTCVLFGEAFPPDDVPGDVSAAEWLLHAFATEGKAALGNLNGSYLAVLDHDGDALVAADPIRSWECYYADVDGARVFGSDVTALKRRVDDHAVDRESVLEMLHLGTVLGDRTLFEAVRRVPFDGYLTATETGTFDRFVYEPRSFDYVDELAERLERAIERRAGYPGSKGLLLSGGKDSRVFLSQVPDIGHTYTVGSHDSREVRVAKNIAAQYDARHRAIDPGEAYLYPSDEKVLYSQSIKETLHIHHGGYDDEFDVDTMYHGLLFDTLFKGYFLEWDGPTVLGTKLESNSLVSDPDPVGSLLDTLGFLPEASKRLPRRMQGVFDDVDLEVGSPRRFLADSLQSEFDRWDDRTASTHNAMDQVVIANQPAMPFRTHIADNYYESFVAMDAELLDWHLTAPPEVRHGDTFRKALERIDGEILRHRPPNQPHTSSYLNQIERFLRRKLPAVEAFEPAWPDRRVVYDDHDLDEVLFPEDRSVHRMPARQKLRVNDVRWWLD